MIRRSLLALAVLAGIAAGPAQAASFVYRGELLDGERPANGRYDLSLQLYDRESGGQAVGAPVELRDVEVSGGRFAAALEIADARALEPGAERWVAVSVREGGGKGAYAPLDARQKAALAATACAAWDVLGNAGTNALFNFVGTTDPAPLVLRTNNQDSMKYEYASTLGFQGINVLAGAQYNQINDNPDGRPVGATIAGGGESFNYHRTTENFSTIGGGKNNAIVRGFGSVVGDPPVAATIAGGSGNLVTALDGTIAGGDQNQVPGDFAVVPGGQFNYAGGFWSFAGGYRARVRTPFGSGIGPEAPDSNGDEGSFVWADSTGAFFDTSGPNQFLVRANGGVGINTSNIANFVDLVIQARSGISGGDSDLDIALKTRNANKGASIFLRDSDGGLVFTSSSYYALGNVTPGAGIYLATNANGANLTTGGTWTNGSSRAFKQDFTAIDAGALLGKVLDMPITTWHYKGSDEGWHLGPMAEDFFAAFGLGADEQHIGTVDEGGVALAAIQGLNAKLEAENERLARENASTRSELARLASRLESLEARLAGDGAAR